MCPRRSQGTAESKLPDFKSFIVMSMLLPLLVVILSEVFGIIINVL